MERLLDSLLEELNMLPKHLVDNQFIAFCSLVSRMAGQIVDAKNELAKMTAKEGNAHE